MYALGNLKTIKIEGKNEGWNEGTDLGLKYVESKNLVANIDESIQQENGHMNLKHICENCWGFVCLLVLFW